MTGYVQHLHLEPEEIRLGVAATRKSGSTGSISSSKPEAAKEFRIGNHRSRIRVATELAAETAFYLRHIRHMVEVPMGEQEQPGR